MSTVLTRQLRRTDEVHPVWPSIRLRPAPPLEPPFDDELSPDVWAAQHRDQLAFDFTALSGSTPMVEACGVCGQLAGGRRSPADAASGERVGGPQTHACRACGQRAGSPIVNRLAARGGAPGGSVTGIAGAGGEAATAARRFLTVCLEVFNGDRPVTQLRPLIAPDAARRVPGQLARGRARAVTLLGSAQGTPRRARPPGRSVTLRVLRLCEPRPGVVEAAAAVATGERTWLLAFRMERQASGWVCAEAIVP